MIKAINRSGAGVGAELNSTGDGICLIDTSNGSKTMNVAESDANTAADLHILGSAKTVSLSGTNTQMIDGSTTYTVSMDSSTTLSNLADKINALDGGFTAKVVASGSTSKLLITSSKTGAATQMVIDTSNTSFSFNEVTEGSDARLAVGASSSGVVLTSSTNTFSNAVDGLTVKVLGASNTTITVNVELDSTTLVTDVQGFVDAYNKFRIQLNNDTAYDTANETGSVLTGDHTAYRLETEMGNLLSGLFANGSVKSLVELGISIDSGNGTLTLDQSTLEQAYEDDPSGVKAFFTTANTGFSAKFCNLADELTAANDSLTANRLDALDNIMSSNEIYMAMMEKRLLQLETRLYNEFYNMELAIQKLQDNASGLKALYQMAYNSSSSSSSSSGSSTSS